MATKLWAEIDEDWRRKEQRALARRAANAAAVATGKPVPYPSPLGSLDPTKVPADASDEEIHESYLEFRKKCRPFQPKRHTI